LHHKVIPQALKGVLSQHDYDKSQAYSRAKVQMNAKQLTFQAKFGFLSRAWGQIINLIVLQYDLMPYFWEITRNWQAAYFGSNYQGEVSSIFKLS
jgi:STE24 endopeptidase